MTHFLKHLEPRKSTIVFYWDQKDHCLVLSAKMSGEKIPEITSWKSKCRKRIRSKNGLLLKNMTTVLRYIDESHGIRRFVSSDGKNNRITKWIILTGVSGSGKSLIINKFINYIYGVKFKDNFRLTLISDDEDNGDYQEPEDEASGTSFVTAYEIIWEKGFPVEFNLILIDTPGFAVDTGIAINEGIVEKIQKFFHSKDFFPNSFSMQSHWWFQPMKICNPRNKSTCLIRNSVSLATIWQKI